mgnify:CR=1 FL=1
MAYARMGRRPVEGNVLWPVLSAGKSRLGLVHRIEYGVISQDPQHFSPATWKFVTETLYPWAMGIGLSMMNVFFICVFLKAASNLKENITLELCIEGMIRLVALNVLMQMGMKLMKTLFSMAALMGGMVLDFQAPDFFTGEVDAGSVLFWWFMGFLYFFIALICGMLIFFNFI